MPTPSSPIAPRHALLLLRVSLGFLLVAWGADKLRDAQHGLLVAAHFYGGLVSSGAVITAFGAVEVLLGLAVAAGVGRRAAYPALLAVTGATLLGVWRSVLDPLGLAFEGTNLLFYPSLIIFAGALVLLALRDQDATAADLVLARRRAAPATEPATELATEPATEPATAR